MTDSPTVGLGTYAMRDPAASVAAGIRLGYRLVDTAASYGNEAEVGRGIAAGGVPRDEIKVTSKLRGRDQGREGARAALRRTLDALGLDHLDLYLIHWPLPRLDLYVESFLAMIEMREQGLVRAVGVSNFEPDHLERLVGETGEAPAVNQIELHPYFPQPHMREFDASLGISTQSWSPLGRKTDLLRDPEVTGVASESGATPAQAVLAWHLALGCTPIPKSDSGERLAENLAALDITLTGEQLDRLSALERGRLGGNPATHEEF